MKNITQITDHATQAGSRLIDWFKGGTFQELVEALAGRHQGLEDVTFPLISERYIANATGQTLTNIGSMVGFERTPGMTDATLRILIYAKIAANTSNGTIPDVYNIMGIVGATNIKVFDVYPAAIEVQYTASQTVSDCGCIRRILEGEDDTDGGATAPIEIGLTQANTESGFLTFGFEGTVGAGGVGVGQIAGAG